MSLFLGLMIFLYGCKNDGPSSVGEITMRGVLQVPAGLTPLKTYYIKVDFQSILPSNQLSTENVFKGNSAYLSIRDNYDWLFLKEAEIVDDNNGSPGIQPYFATDYYSETSTDNLLLLPFKEIVPASVALSGKPSFFIKLTPLASNTRTFTTDVTITISAFN